MIERDGMLIVVDEVNRMRWQPHDRLQQRTVRFRTLGCWPVTAAVESHAGNLAEIIEETLQSSASERSGRLGDSEEGGSLEMKKREGYF